jgi:hypothetical protein
LLLLELLDARCEEAKPFQQHRLVRAGGGGVGGGGPQLGLALPFQSRQSRQLVGRRRRNSRGSRQLLDQLE